MGFPFFIRPLAFSKNSDWFDILGFIKSLVAGPYHFIMFGTNDWILSNTLHVLASEKASPQSISLPSS